MQNLSAKRIRSLGLKEWEPHYNAPPFTRLLAIYRWMDVPLHLVKTRASPLLSHPAPKHKGGIVCDEHTRYHRPRSVVWMQADTRSQQAICALAHELAHVLHGVCPTDADEVRSPMLAIEAAVHEFCGVSEQCVQWWMRSFYIHGDRWDENPWSERLDIMLASRERAIKRGILDKRGHFVWRAS